MRIISQATLHFLLDLVSTKKSYNIQYLITDLITGTWMTFLIFNKLSDN